MYLGDSSKEFVVIVLITIYCPSVCGTTNAHANVTPTAYNASLHQDNEVHFHCTVHNVSNQEPLWSIIVMDTDYPSNTQQFQNRGIRVSEAQQLGPSSYASTLTIPSTLGNNNTRLQCLALNVHGISDRSTIALFRVQGRLNAPRNVTSESFNSTHYEVMWHAPYTLDVTDQPDILGHSVCTTLQESVATCVNINESETRYFILKLTLRVTIAISSWNAVGEGESTSIQLQPCTFEGHQKLQQSSVYFEDKPVFRIQVLTNSTNCFTAYQLQISNSVYSSSVAVIPTVIQSNDQENVTVLLIYVESEELISNTHFTGLLTAINAHENLTISTNRFSTFDVQKVEFFPGNGRIAINCSFAEGTRALGCHIILASDSGTVSTNATRQCYNTHECLSAYVEIELVPDQYNASVFDLELNNTIDHSNAAFLAAVDIAGDPVGVMTGSLSPSSVMSSGRNTPNALSSVLIRTTINTTLAQPNKETNLIIGVCVSVGGLSVLIGSIVFAIGCVKKKKKKQAPTEVIYEEPMAIAPTVILEACVAYKTFSPKAKQPCAEVIYDEPVTPPERTEPEKTVLTSD